MSQENKYPLVTVIICTFNGGDKILIPLNSLLKQNYPLERIQVIIVDDGSESLVKISNSQYSSLSIEIKRNSINKGLGFSRHLAVLKSKGDFVAFTDDDCSPGPNWIKDIVDSFNEFPDASALGGKIIASELSNVWELYTEQAKMSIFNHIAKDNKTTLKNYFKRFFSQKKFRFYHGQSLTSCMGLNSSYRGDVIRSLRPNPFLRRGVDLELNLRLIKKNHKIVYVDKMIVKHPHRKTFLSFAKHNFVYGMNTYNCHKRMGSKVYPYPFPLIGGLAELLFILIILHNKLFFSVPSLCFGILLLLIPILGTLIIYYSADLLYAIQLKELVSFRLKLVIFPFAHFARDFFWDVGWLIGHFLKLRNKSIEK